MRKPEARATAHAQVYAELRRMMMSGTFQPGERLVLRDLAERFGTSPMPIREALRQLVSEGIVAGAFDGYLAPNRRFHFAIYRAARSPAMMQIIERLRLRAGPWLNIMRETTPIQFGFDHHADILSALRAGDGARARHWAGASKLRALRAYDGG